jgi:hypothetical protein
MPSAVVMPRPDPGIHLFKNAGLPDIWLKTRFALMPGNDEEGKSAREC